MNTESRFSIPNISPSTSTNATIIPPDFHDKFDRIADLLRTLFFVPHHSDWKRCVNCVYINLYTERIPLAFLFFFPTLFIMYSFNINQEGSPLFFPHSYAFPLDKKHYSLTSRMFFLPSLMALEKRTNTKCKYLIIINIHLGKVL